jgi:hypothetical protein
LRYLTQAVKGKGKSLGCVAMALVAMGIFGTAGAQASVLMTGGNVPATLLGQETEGEPWVFEAGTGENRGEGVCSTTKFTTKLTTSPVEELTIAPEYGGCEFQIQAVDTNLTGCGYRAYGFTFTEKDTFHGSVDLVCPTGKQIDTTITAFGQAVCILTMLPSKKVGRAEVTNITPGFIVLKIEIFSTLNLKFDSLVPGGCQGESSEEVMEDGSVTGSLTISATNESAESVALTME